MAAVTPALIHRMEQHLVEDSSIKQAKIVDLASPNAPERDLVVAVSFTSTSDDSISTRTVRRSLVRKMRDVGGKAVVPRKWTQPADLPVTPAGDVDEAALRQTLLIDAAAEAVQPVETLDSKIMRAVATATHIPQDELVQTRSFAENGGDSFTAIQVFQCLMREGVSLRVPDIMRAASLAELPSLVISRHGGPAPSAPPAPVSEVHEVKLPENPAAVSVATVTV